MIFLPLNNGYYFKSYRKEPMIYIFDIDNTLYKGSTVRKFLLPAFCRGVLPPKIIFSIPRYFFYFRRRDGDPSVTEKRIAALRGIRRGKMRELAEELFIREYRDSLHPLLVRGINKAKRNREPVILASSSFRTLIEPIAEHLGADDVIATEIAFRDGVATGFLRTVPPYRRGKRLRVMEYIASGGQKMADVVFYSDHHDDLPLLYAAGKAVAVNPTRKLRRIARREGWEVLEGRKN